MADSMPPIALTFTEDNKPQVHIGTEPYTDWASVVSSAEGLTEPENAVKVARMMTHLTFRGRYRVIEDPAQYEADYRARIEAEAPDQPFEQNVVRARSFGIPDFSSIAAPAINGGKLVYFVYDTALNVPYKVEADPANPDLTAQTHTLLPMSPV